MPVPVHATAAGGNAEQDATAFARFTQRDDGALALLDCRRVPGELFDGGVLEDVGEGGVDFGVVADAGEELDGEEGVSAEVEEVVVDADAVGVEDVLPDV